MVALGGRGRDTLEISIGRRTVADVNGGPGRDRVRVKRIGKHQSGPGCGRNRSEGFRAPRFSWVQPSRGRLFHERLDQRLVGGPVAVNDVFAELGRLPKL